MQVAGKSNRNPGFNLDEKGIAHSMWDWSPPPSENSRSQHSFSPAVFSLSLSPPLSQFVIPALLIKKLSIEQHFLNIKLLYFSFSSQLGSSHQWYQSFFLRKGSPLEGWGRDRCSCDSVCCKVNKVCLEICTALCLPWLQHCGGRAEVKNQNPCCALACLNTVQEVWIAWSWGSCCSLLTEALC